MTIKKDQGIPTTTTMDLVIPEDLGPLMREFTIAVLDEKPSSLVDFAVEHFRSLQDGMRNGKIPSTPSNTTTGGQSNHVTTSVPMYIIVDDDDMAVEPDKDTLKPKGGQKYARRGSVSAERYDPEEDENNDEPLAVHEKTEEQRANLLNAIKDILLFRSLDSSQMGDVVNAMFERKVVPNETVIKAGDDGDNFYVINRGRFGVMVGSGPDKKRVHQFENSGSFGELALMYNMPRSATVVAETEGYLWAMDRQSFRRIVLSSAFKKRKLYEQILKEVPILKSLDQYELMSLADALVTKEFKRDDPIIKEGDEADGMYFVESGTVSVSVSKGGQSVEVTRLTKGKYFGEVALIEDKPRTASVRAVEHVKLAFLEVQSFERLLGPCLDIMKRKTGEYRKKK